MCGMARSVLLFAKGSCLAIWQLDRGAKSRPSLLSCFHGGLGREGMPGWESVASWGIGKGVVILSV
jgi:hypothetical protein